MKANTTEYKRAYVEKNYARISVTIPKGQKAAVEAHAQQKGESVNGLVNALLQADMGLSEEEWKGRQE
ncbi:MAG: antitoxin [Clostridia bacterium]|nr:antitoxin [Clostridia bacterium]